MTPEPVQVDLPDGVMVVGEVRAVLYLTADGDQLVAYASRDLDVGQQLATLVLSQDTVLHPPAEVAP